MTIEAIEPGDLVTLKSGGPKMVAAGTPVKSSRGVEEWACFWFDQTGAMHDKLIPTVCLTKAKD